MNSSTAVERIVELLGMVGYRQLSTPFEIGRLPFNFSAALVGTGRLPDLILVADTSSEDERRIQRQLEAVARAMDVVGSKRPLTAVVIGPRPQSNCLSAMSQVCRVLPLGIVTKDYPDTVLKDWLAVLMPLTLPTQGSQVADTDTEIRNRLTNLPADIVAMLELAEKGSNAVEKHMVALISAPFEPDTKDQDSGDGSDE